MVTFRFEDLIVWQRSVDLADMVYEFTSNFPQNEQFGITNQMRCAAVSVSSNIAEGDGRTGSKDRARFLEISYGSLMELVSQSTIAVRRSYLSEPNCDKLRMQSDEIARMLSGLRQRWLAD